jgi:hypothetical protein
MHFSGPCNCCQLLMACLRETSHDFFMHILYYFRRFAGLLNHRIHRMQQWFSPYFKAIISFAMISTKYNYNRKCIGRLRLIIARYVSYIFNSNSSFLFIENKHKELHLKQIISSNKSMISWGNFYFNTNNNFIKETQFLFFQIKPNSECFKGNVLSHN